MKRKTSRWRMPVLELQSWISFCRTKHIEFGRKILEIKAALLFPEVSRWESFRACKKSFLHPYLSRFPSGVYIIFGESV